MKIVEGASQPRRTWTYPEIELRTRVWGKTYKLTGDPKRRAPPLVRRLAAQLRLQGRPKRRKGSRDGFYNTLDKL
ncbi:MAG: hypothetical protein ACXQTZ_04585 [Candidatus Alkanophagales archaeon]